MNYWATFVAQMFKKTYKTLNFFFFFFIYFLYHSTNGITSPKDGRRVSGEDHEVGKALNKINRNFVLWSCERKEYEQGLKGAVIPNSSYHLWLISYIWSRKPPGLICITPVTITWHIITHFISVTSWWHHARCSNVRISMRGIAYFYRKSLGKHILLSIFIYLEKRRHIWKKSQYYKGALLWKYFKMISTQDALII